MANLYPNSNNAAHADGDFFQQAVSDWLTQAPADLLDAAFYVALAHRADDALLAAVWQEKTKADINDLLTRLVSTSVITVLEPGYYVFTPTVRTLLLQQWQRRDRTAYRSANAQLAAFYRHAWLSGEPEQIEYVYHQLGADDALGIQVLFKLFESSLAVQRLGVAERLIEYADEQIPVLGPDAQAWVQYFRARLAIVHNRFTQAEETLRMLATQADDVLLRAQTLLSLAEAQVASLRWATAQLSFREAEKLFRQQGDHFNSARAFELHGLAYLDLATSLGGLQEDEVTLFEPPYRAWLHGIQHAPFLLYRWFSRRIAFLPNLYFSTNYQDWGIIRLFYQAIAQFEKAAYDLAKVTTASDLPIEERAIDIQIRLADLYHHVGQWSVAERKLAHVAPAVASPVADEYRFAMVRSLQGRAAYARGRLPSARDYLQLASQIFDRLNDKRAFATTQRLLAQVETKARHYDRAISLFAASIEASLLTSDLLAATQTWSLLTTMSERYPIAQETATQVNAIVQRLDRRAYIARFPGALLRTFQLLAFFVVTPVTYLVISQIALVGGQLLPGFLEVLFNQLSTLYAASQTELLVDAVLLIGCACLALWLYEGFYLFLGWFFVRRLKIRDLVEQQPEYVVTTPEGIVVRDQNDGLTEVPWATVQKQISVDRALWRTPLALFSRQILLAHPTQLALNGILSHYQSLKRDLASRLRTNQRDVLRQTFDFSVLKSRWLIVALLVTLILAGIDFFQLPDRTCRDLAIIQATLRGSEYAYIVDGAGDVRTFDISGYGALTEVSRYQLPAPAIDLAITDQYAYVVTANNHFYILDIQDRSAPQEIGSYTIQGEAKGITVHGNYAYIAAGAHGLELIDITDPTKPTAVSVYDTPGNASKVAIVDKIALIADQSGGLRLLNVDNPGAPSEIGAYATDITAWDVAVQNRYAYVVDKDFGLRVIDISEPATPLLVGSVRIAGESLALASERTFVTVAGTQGIHVIHVWDPTDPYEVGMYNMVGSTSAIAVALGVAYVASNEGGVHAIDIINPCDEITALDAAKDIKVAQRVEILPPYSLFVTSLLSIFLDWATLLFPIQALIRLILNRARLRHVLQEKIRWYTEVPLWVALVLLCYWIFEKFQALAG